MKEKNNQFKNQALLGLFICAIILANTLGIKIINLFGINVSFGIFFIPILFLVTDIISEVYGKKKAQQFVYIGSAILIFSILMMYIAVKISPSNIWNLNSEYSKIFMGSIRMSIASVIAFLVSQFHDVWAFDIIKRKTKGKYLWLRNNLSTIISQFIDTTIFIFIAFYKIQPGFNINFIISMIFPFWIVKIILSLLDTPLCYLGVRWLKK